MTQTLERPGTLEGTQAVDARTPRGGSYVTLPGHLTSSERTEAGYVSLPGTGSHVGNNARGSYVTLYPAPLAETDTSYTRRGY